MKKFLNKFLAVIMAVTTIFVGLPIVSATDGSEHSSKSTSDVSLSNGTALDMIVSDLSEGADNEDFSIVSLKMDENTAILNVKNIKACSAIVAIYNEDTMQMYASGIAEVPVEHEDIIVGINIDEMPEYYVAKAFLVNSNYAPLCKSFESLEYTKKFEKFLNCTPEDFEDELVIVFDDEKEQADFAVLVDNAVVTNKPGNMTFNYDDKELKYTFFDAVDEVKSLEKGDVYYLKYGKKSNEFILIKVKSVSSSGSTVTVIQDSDVTLSDVFSFIRIDSQGEYDSINDDIELGRALIPVDDTVQTMSLNEEEKWSGTYEFDISSDGVVITFLKIATSDNPLEKLEEEILIDDSVICDSEFSLSGTLKYEFAVKLKLYYDPEHMGEEYFDFNLDTHYTVKLMDTRLEGSVKLAGILRELLTANFEVAVGCLTLDCHIAPILEISSGLEFNALNYGYFVVAANKNGIQKTDSIKKEYDVEANAEIKSGVEIGISSNFTSALSLSLTGEFGTRCVVSADSSCMNAGKKLHYCDRCYSRSEFGFIALSLGLKFMLHPDFKSLPISPLKWSKDDYLIDEYYTSYKDGVKNGPNKGICPNILFRAKINVISLDGESVPNAEIYCIDGVCDSDGDNNYEELKNVINTDRYGTAFCYFKPGIHIVKAMSKNNNYGQTKFEVIRDEVEVTIKLDEALDDIETSGTCGDNVYWEFDMFRGVLTISGNGEMIDFNIQKTPPWNSFGHHINEVVIENGVTSIGDNAFNSYNNLLNAYIADSVNRIGNLSFYSCLLLRSIHIPDSVKTVGDCAFQYCKELETAYLGEGLTKIPKKMFELCSKLSSVTMNVGLTEIGEYAFFNANLSSVKIPYGVTHIYKSAFFGQGKTGKTVFDEIYIPETIEYIDESAFWNSISGTEIGTVYFGGSQSRWNSLVKDSYIEHKGNYVLINANIVFNHKFDQTGYVKPTEIFTGTYTENCMWAYDSATYTLTVDGTGAMKNYSKSGSVPWSQHIPYIKKVVVKDGITHIGAYNFASHPLLKTIVLGKGIETIGDYAFSGCHKLQTVNLEDCLSLTTIGVGALSQGTNSDLPDVDLKSIVLPNSVRTINDTAFQGANLVNITLNDGLESIGTRAFYFTDLEKITIPNSVKVIGNQAFALCSSLETAYLGKGITKIPDKMFQSCKSLSSVTMNVGITEIGEYAFESANLNVIDIPQGVTHIGEQAFSFQGGAGKKSQIDKIYIPETIEYIGESAFWNSGRGTEIGTVYFGGSQSRWDSLVKDYYIEPDGNQVLINANIVFNYKFDQTGYVKPTEVFTGTFEENCTWSYDSATYTLTVDGTGAMKNYSQSGSVPWHQHIPYIKKVVIKDGITHIGNCNFASHPLLKTIVLGKGIETIGDYAISGCYKLQTVNLEDCLNLTTIGVGAFSLSHGTNTDMTDVDLKPIVLPNSVRTIKDTAFRGANLVNISLNDGLESIGANAFYFTALEEITIPDSVKVIGNQAFALCSSLETAYLGKGITKIPDKMFQSCKSLSSVTMNVGITEIGEYAFESANLNVIDIPQGVTHIGKQAFSFQGGAGKKSQIDKIYIPETIEYIGESAFWNSGRGTEIGTLYFGGTQSQWQSLVDSGNIEPKGNLVLINANIVFDNNGDVSAFNEKMICVCSVEPIVSVSNVLETESASADSIKNISLIYDKCIAGNQYILLKVMDYTDDFNLTTENLCFVNQLEADENGVVETSFRTTANGDNSAILLVGDFGKGNEIIVVNPSDVIDEFEIIWIVDNKEFRVLAEEGSSIVKPEISDKSGYTFTGWTPQVPDVMPAENLTFTATWSANLYSAVFDANGGIWADGATKKTVATEYGNAIVAPENPSKDGYLFSGWNPEVGIMDDVNGKTFTAEWISSKETTYTVETYTMNTVGEYEKVLNMSVGTAGETVTAEYTVPAGFTLNSEKSVLDGTVTADNSLVLKVYLDRNAYAFTTVVDGISTSTGYLYGTIIAEPVTPEKAGYKFVEWDGFIPKTMPAGDVTITAVFEKSYTCPDCGNEILGEDSINEHIAAETRMKAIVKIKNNNGSNTIKYGETLRLTAITTNMPADAKIYWYVDGVKKGEGETFNVSFENGTKTVEVKVVDSNGNVLKSASGNEIKDSESVTVKGGFFQKIISFFKNLFGMNRTVVQAIFKGVL